MKLTTVTKKPLYEWDDERGVVTRGKDGVTLRVLQLLHGLTSKEFRIKCGRLLVAALNKENKK